MLRIAGIVLATVLFLSSLGFNTLILSRGDSSFLIGLPPIWILIPRVVRKSALSREHYPSIAQSLGHGISHIDSFCDSRRHNIFNSKGPVQRGRAHGECSRIRSRLLPVDCEYVRDLADFRCVRDSREGKTCHSFDPHLMATPDEGRSRRLQCVMSSILILDSMIELAAACAGQSHV